MTGLQHFREAERLLAQVDDGAADWEPIAAAAQVHATLALAAATATAFSLRPQLSNEVRELWTGVTS